MRVCGRSTDFAAGLAQTLRKRKELPSSRHAPRVGDIELGGHCMQDRDGHGGRVFEKGSQEARRRELQRIPQAAAIAPLGGDPLSIVIVIVIVKIILK